MRKTAALALFVLACVGTTRAAGAQQLQGTVRVTGRAAPLSDATIVLVDSAGHLAGGTVSDRTGRYALRTAAPGRYRVRVRRIGFAPDTTHFVMLTNDATVHLDPVLRPVPSLDQVVVRATRACDEGASPDPAAVRLWDDTQSALTATVLTSQSGKVGFLLRRHEREVDAKSGHVIREQSAEARVAGATPYASISAESLGVHGFIQRGATWSTYYAPDAGTLISDRFVSSHCFHAVQDSAQPELVGLAFVPMRASATVDDVEGTLWLDRATSELRFLTFTYRTPERSIESGFTATGKVEFRNEPGTGWIVSRWRIDVPVTRAVRTRTATSGEAIGSTMVLSTHTMPEVSRLFEAGGEVLSTFAIATEDSARPVRASLGGRLLEEGSGTPIGNGAVRLILRGTTSPREVMTDSTGAFRFDDLESGTYAVEAGASSDAMSSGSEISITAGTRTSLTLTVRRPPDPLATLCPGGQAKGRSRIRGRVTESASEVAAPGVTVRVRWSTIALVRDGEYSVTPEQRLTTTSSDGRYAICDVPQDVPLFVSVSRGSRRGAETRTQVGRTDAATLDLEAP